MADFISNDNNPAVTAKCTGGGGIGVKGESQNSSGVFGMSHHPLSAVNDAGGPALFAASEGAGAGIGVSGLSVNNAGVRGESQTHNGVLGTFKRGRKAVAEGCRKAGAEGCLALVTRGAARLAAAFGTWSTVVKDKTMKVQKCKLAVLPLALIFLADLRTAAQDHAALPIGASAEDRPNVHNMLVVGSEAVFLSHLPMFKGLNQQATDYTSPHRYQVILEVSFTGNGKDVTDIYTKDRQGSTVTKMYTLSPEPLVLARLFTPDAQNPALSSFKATVTHGHLERDPHHVIGGLEDVVVTVKKVIHAQKFDPAATKPAKLPYFLFGKGEELFLAHLITKPPDFDQIVSVKVADHPFTEEELNRGVSVVFPDRDNTASQRIKENQHAPGQFQVTGIPQSFESAVQAGTEYYFEEGELAMPATFEQTPEEAKAGF